LRCKTKLLQIKRLGKNIFINPMQAKNMQSLSVYIHVPFCMRKCNYCDFYSELLKQSVADDYIDALCIEWTILKEKYHLENIPVKTLYVGGGTPSLLTLGQWNKLIEKLVKQFHFVPDYEWSIECNPDSFSPETAAFWLDSGVTRLSIGIQSLDDNELRLLGRVHTSGQAIDLLNNPVLLKFASTGADLMYGIPGQTPASLGMSIDKTLSALSLRHLSVYELTINLHSDFGKRRATLPLPSEEATIAMTEIVLEKTHGRGFEQYEISNFSIPGHHCKHNEAYWQHTPYIGLGPAAHSYLPPCRFSNCSSIVDYGKALGAGKLPTNFSETIDAASLSREMVFLGLRTNQGIDETKFRLMTGVDFASTKRLPTLETFVCNGMIEHKPPFWSLTRKGMLFADAIARDLL
jgi:oxygen-independent coproporphyrinogen III oxidase